MKELINRLFGSSEKYHLINPKENRLLTKREIIKYIRKWDGEYYIRIFKEL